ncbi:MAG: hypothetical protein RLZZ396_949 [Planctomycetota bacterium]
MFGFRHAAWRRGIFDGIDRIDIVDVIDSAVLHC